MYRSEPFLYHVVVISWCLHRHVLINIHNFFVVALGKMNKQEFFLTHVLRKFLLTLEAL